jgi:hypothetical protein
MKNLQTFEEFVNESIINEGREVYTPLSLIERKIALMERRFKKKQELKKEKNPCKDIIFDEYTTLP